MTAEAFVATCFVWLERGDSAAAFASLEADELGLIIKQRFRVRSLCSEIASVVSSVCFCSFICFPSALSAAFESHFGGLCVFHVVILSSLLWTKEEK